MTLLCVDNIDVQYGQGQQANAVVRGFSMTINEGEIACLLGPSGCGKTTVLRALAGFEVIRAGSILLNGQIIATPERMVPPEQRQIGMMFQDYALFPHLTVAKNVGFGLASWPKGKAAERVRDMLELVGLSEFGKRYPHELSGGQQQRIALARALAPKPRLLLLDEAFSNLDVDTRERLAAEVRAILKANGLSAMLVTHHQSEALAIGDKIGWMRDGQVLEWQLNQPDSLAS